MKRFGNAVIFENLKEMVRPGAHGAGPLGLPERAGGQRL